MHFTLRFCRVGQALGTWVVSSVACPAAQLACSACSPVPKPPQFRPVTQSRPVALFRLTSHSHLHVAKDQDQDQKAKGQAKAKIHTSATQAPVNSPSRQPVTQSPTIAVVQPDHIQLTFVASHCSKRGTVIRSVAKQIRHLDLDDWQRACLSTYHDFEKENIRSTANTKIRSRRRGTASIMLI